MLSKEEVEVLKNLIDYYNSDEFDEYEALSYTEINALEHLMQAYKEQQAELEKARNTKSLYYENKELRKELKNKDKIIDEAIKVIIDSSICDYFIKQNCKHYAGENKKTCDDCIKQYFERKVEDVK